jgi:hypothetical protein
MSPAQGTQSTAPAAKGIRIDPLTGQSPSTAELNDLLRNLQAQLAVLRAQRKVLAEGSRSSEPVLRAQAQQTLLNVDVDIASTEARIAEANLELARRGTSTETAPAAPPPPGNPPMIDPDAITAVFVMTALAILVPVSIGLARRLWRRPPVAPSMSALEDKLSPRFDRLEQAVDAIAIEVERISEAQRFVAKVLAERPPAATAQMTNDAAAVGDAKPFLALGAGPMEPIRMAERQAVKQSITPH